ncbi:MAG: hypothetical protein EZS28_030633, partial [Streblomastix strix]
MADVESAERAQFELNRHILDGRQIRVEFAKERKMKKYQLDQLHQIIQDIHSIIETKISLDNYQFEEILANDYNIIAHLTHPLIQFASQSQFNKKTDSQEYHNQQQSESSSSISLITSSLNILNNLIYNYDNNKYKEVIKTPKALHSLITLSIYKIGTHFNQENDQQTLALRSGSIRCLQHIHCSSDASAQSELVNSNYIGVLVIAFSTASGHGEEKGDEIYDRLFCISRFFKQLNQGSNNQPTFPPQPLLARRSDEQIEEEGGNEEIDSQLINKGHQYCDIKDIANYVKGRILNYFIEQSNTRPEWGFIL